MSPLKLVRPTMAPEVMVEAVSAKANWNSKKARNATVGVEHAAVVVGRRRDAPRKKSVADQAVAAAELKAKPMRPVQEAAEARVEDALHEDVDRTRGSGRSRPRGP